MIQNAAERSHEIKTEKQSWNLPKMIVPNRAERNLSGPLGWEWGEGSGGGGKKTGGITAGERSAPEVLRRERKKGRVGGEWGMGADCCFSFSCFCTMGRGIEHV